MKKPLIKIAATLLLTGWIVSGCNLSSTKVEDARDNVQDARENLTEANQAFYAARKDSIEQFKRESEEKISMNDKRIAEFKAKIAKVKKEDKANYEKSLAWLEQQNRDMKKDLADFNDDGQDKWTSFKGEFNHDMDEFGKAIKDLTVDNIQ